jgi:hypothetical protein
MDAGDGNWIERRRDIVKGKDPFPLLLSILYFLSAYKSERQLSYGLLLLLL